MPNTKLSDITAAKRLSLLPDCEFNVAHRLSYASVLGDAAQRTARRDARRVMLPSKSVEENLMSTRSTAVPNAAAAAAVAVAVPHNMVTTAFTLDGYRIVRNLGLVRGIIVRSRSIIGTIGAGLQTLVGGNITLLTNLCEKTREHAFELMLLHAAELGANAVIGMRYDATEVMQGVTEVLAYGTAVYVEKEI